MFDGDEMNVHAVQSTITEQEVKNIALVPTQIISPSKCKPIITIIQDPLVGGYLMTQDDTILYKNRIENLMMNIKDFTGKLPAPDGKDDNGFEYWSGKKVYSMILPDISLNLVNNSDEVVSMKNGKYLSGRLDSSILGSRGLIQDILNTYGKDRCHKFLDATQSLLIKWMESQGFSVGLGDAVPINKEMKDKIEEIIDNKVEESKKMITLAYQGLYEPQLENELRLESMDLLMKKIAGDCANEVVKYIKKELPADNRFKVMVQSGAKGKTLNIQQIIGIVGQQDIWGSRIQDGFSHRTLPHFHKYDFGLSAKGFVRNSFVKGLGPAEFFFSMMGGRTGMIDTAVKTAESGYISRRLIKALEDVKILYDGTVRNASNNIVQLIYGDDGYDPIKLERVLVDLIKYNNLEMEDRYKFDLTSEKDWENIVLKSTMKELLGIKDYKEKLEKEYEMMVEYRDKLRNVYFVGTDVIDIPTFMPFNLYRFIPAVKYKFNIGEKSISDLSPIYIIDRVKELCDSVTKYMRDKNANELTKIIIKSYLSPKMVIVKHKLNKIAFDYIIKDLEYKILAAFVQPGEMVGPVSAQSLGEVSTQLTLNTFHSAGAAAGSVVVTSGVPRLKEIINLSRAMKIPSMTLYLKGEYATDRVKAEEVKNQVEYTKLRNIIMQTQIIYERESGIDIENDEDTEFLKLYEEFNELICVDSHEDLSKWVLRMEFDRESMMSKNILMTDIQEAILQNSQTEEAIQCTFSDDNSGNLIMRIKVKSEADDEYFLSFLKDLEKFILDMTLRGIKDIKAANLVEGNLITYDADGSYKTVKEWKINTNGSNLSDAMLLDYIDTERSMTNDVVESYEIFGIEGVRMRIIKELEKVFAESTVNQRHIALLADIMTYRGTLMQIDRHGINRSPDNGVIAKASFEEVMDVFVKASTFSEFDKMNGMSANIMFGQVAPCGTNAFDIIFDEEKFMDNIIDVEDQTEYEPEELDEDVVQQEINDMYEDTDEELEITDADFEFGYSLENIVEHNIGPIKQEEDVENVKVVNRGIIKKIIRKK